MTDDDIKMLVEASDRLVSRVPVQFQRYLSPNIDWNEKMLCIKGPKGTGKTTMILQHVKESLRRRIVHDELPVLVAYLPLPHKAPESFGCGQMPVEQDSEIPFTRERAFHPVGHVEDQEDPVQEGMFGNHESSVYPAHLLERLMGERRLHELQVVPCEAGNDLETLHLPVVVTDGIHPG